MWYLIVSIPDLCTITYFEKQFLVFLRVAVLTQVLLYSCMYTQWFTIWYQTCGTWFQLIFKIVTFLHQPFYRLNAKRLLPGRVAQLVTCLATDACLTADSGVTSSIPVRSHTFVEIDHEMISTVILLPSADLFKKGCCQLQAKVCARITG